MKASREWGTCSCNCGDKILAGDEFVIVEGAMYLTGHEDRRTRQIPVIKPDRKGKQTRTEN